MSPRRPRGFAATLLGYAGAGLAIGAIGSSAIMLWLLRTPPTISRAELDAIARARGTTAAMPLPVAPPTPTTPTAAPDAPAPTDSVAAADSAMGVAPPVIGLSEESARTLVLAAGFALGGVSSVASDRPIGEVVATFPEPGERVPLPAAINLILSAGPARPPADTTVPPDTIPLHRR
jgi:hypothetical protein